MRGAEIHDRGNPNFPHIALLKAGARSAGFLFGEEWELAHKLRYKQKKRCEAKPRILLSGVEDGIRTTLAVTEGVP